MSGRARADIFRESLTRLAGSNLVLFVDDLAWHHLALGAGFARLAVREQRRHR